MSQTFLGLAGLPFCEGGTSSHLSSAHGRGRPLAHAL